jgi:hypothetical protein
LSGSIATRELRFPLRHTAVMDQDQERGRRGETEEERRQRRREEERGRRGETEEERGRRGKTEEEREERRDRGGEGGEERWRTMGGKDTFESEGRWTVTKPIEVSWI